MADNKINSISTADALKTPGVLLILTAKDIKEAGYGTLPCMIDLKNRDGSNMAKPARPILADGFVRHVGDPVAFIVAETMEAARDAVSGAERRPKLIAVTLLTSMAAKDMREVGIEGDPAAAALRLAKLTQASGLDGVVCSAQEAALLKRECGAGFRLVTPGIRPAFGAKDDQQRIMTPAAAMAAGADYLVIGRPVTQAPDPVAALAAINAEIAGRQNA